MGTRTNKSAVREMLADRDLDAVAAWAGSVRSPQRVLFSLALDADELIAWRAIEAIGKVAAIQAQNDIEKTRDSVRRLLWLMNDESGGLGWRSPEIIGEILINVPSLIEEYGAMLPAFFNEEPFERGSYMAVARVAAVRPKPFRGNIEILEKSLDNSDPDIRFHAASALWSIDAKNNRRQIQNLRNDNSPLTFYDFNSGALVSSTVGMVVTEIMEKTPAAPEAA